MGKLEMDKAQAQLIKITPSIVKAITDAITNNLDEKFDFALFIYNEETGSLAGSQNPDDTIHVLKRLVEHHEGICGCHQESSSPVKH